MIRLARFLIDGVCKRLVYRSWAGESAWELETKANGHWSSTVLDYPADASVEHVVSDLGLVSDPIPEIVTSEFLSRYNPCDDGYERFLASYPKGVSLTDETLTAFVEEQDYEIGDLEWLLSLLGWSGTIKASYGMELHYKYGILHRNIADGPAYRVGNLVEYITHGSCISREYTCNPTF